MNENKSYEMNYLSFLIFAYKNFFYNNKWLKSKQGEIVYYENFHKDFHYIKISSELISILIIIILYFFAKMDIFSVIEKLQRINSFLHLLPFYVLALFVYVFITLIVYSLKYNRLEYYDTVNKEDVPNKYMYALNIWNKHGFAGSSSFLNNCIICTSLDVNFKYQYAFDKLYFFINRILRLIMIFVSLWTENLFAETYFAEGDYLTFQLAIILILQVFSFLLSYLQIIKYKKVEFERTY